MIGFKGIINLVVSLCYILFTLDAAHKTRFLAHVARLNGALLVLHCVSPVAVGVVYTFFIRVSTVRSSNPSPSPSSKHFVGLKMAKGDYKRNAGPRPVD